jgi:hypothetical protein
MVSEPPGLFLHPPPTEIAAKFCFENSLDQGIHGVAAKCCAKDNQHDRKHFFGLVQISILFRPYGGKNYHGHIEGVQLGPVLGVMVT